MAENFDDDFKAEMLDFKAQMLRFVGVAEQKFDGLSSDVRENSFRIDKVEQNLDRVEKNLGNSIDGVEQNLGQKVDVLDQKADLISSKLDQVTGKVVDHEKRIRNLEGNAATSPTIS